MSRWRIGKSSMCPAAAVALLCAAVPCFGDSGPRLRELSVDGTATVGTLRLPNAVSGAPSAEFAAVDIHHTSPTVPTATVTADLSAAYRTAGIELIRTHDAFGAGDIDARFDGGQALGFTIPASRGALTIFPDPNADTESPASYRFGPTDRLIASIMGAGAEPLFRIGRSIGAPADPPADPERYARIVRHIVMHYNGGWDAGFHYGIRYWEIWNEPDFKFFWNGSAQQFYALYAAASRAIRAADPAARVGGPTISGPLEVGAYREGFLDYVRSRHLPLDFFSWHFYTLDSDDPYAFATIAREVRKVLDGHGFRKVPSFLDEWNADLFDRDMSVASRASFVANALIDMARAPIDLQVFYRADRHFRGAGGEPDAVAEVLSEYGALRRSPLLLRCAGGDDAGLGMIAGRSKDGRTIRILISNYQIPARYLGPRPGGDRLHIPNVMEVQLPARRAVQYTNNGGYSLSIHVPAHTSWRVRRARIDEASGYRSVDDAEHSGPQIHLSAALPPPGVEFITLQEQPQGGGPF